MVCDHFCKQPGIKNSLIQCFSVRKALGWLSTHGFSSPRGREGVVFRSRVLSVSFHVLPLSQSNFVSLGLLWSPCESPDLLLPQSSIIHWHVQGHGSNRNTGTLPDGLWKAGHLEVIPVPRLFIEWERQQTQPMKSGLLEKKPMAFGVVVCS